MVCGHILFCCCNPLGFLYRSIFIQWNPSSTAERQIGQIVCNLIASSQKSRFEWSPSHLTHKVFRWYIKWVKFYIFPRRQHSSIFVLQRQIMRISQCERETISKNFESHNNKSGPKLWPGPKPWTFLVLHKIRCLLGNFFDHLKLVLGSNKQKNKELSFLHLL